MLRAVSSGLALFLLLASPAFAADEPVTLRYKMDKEAPLIYRTATSLKQEQTVGNMQITSEVANTDVSVRTLQKVDENGNLQIQTENKLLQAKFKVDPVGEYEFDSQSTERDTGSLFGGLIGPYYDRLSGAILNLTVSPRGELVEVKGYKELVGDLLANNPALAQFGASSDDSARHNMSEQFVYLSEEPVKPGDTWEHPYEMELPKLGKMQGKQIYKYIGPDKVGDIPTAKISVTTQMDFDLNIETDAAKVVGRMSIGDSNGTIQFDPEKGCIVSKDFSFTMGGNLTISAGGNEFPVQTNQTQSVKVELLEKLPE
jgi:hypothetical protein